MATITKRATGYQVQIRRRGFPSVSKMFDTKRDAEAWSRMNETQMDQGIYLDRSEADKTTLGEILLRYKREVTPLKKSAENENIRIDRLVRDESLCQYKATALTGKLFAEWRDKRSQQVTGSTVNREIDILSHAINTARKEWGIHIANPVEMIRRPKHNKSRERRLSEDEESKILFELQTKTRNPWIKHVVVFAIETGMRRGEILSLTWSNVDLHRRVARLIDTKNGEGRSVPLTLKATALLEGLPRSIDGRVFATTAEAVKLAFARAVERSGIDDLHFHDLRHEGVSRLFEKGLNVMEVASISGHKTLQMLKRYTHLSADVLLAKIG
ncbi:MAG: site-specific integrase [Azonexaceae bacterium]|nr:site-specific integrase [Azonexaceae bacterium]